ncbi:putative sterol-sensing domain of SREBP cleavage-activation [Lyophyllum shimeji]|uniref:Sterol regulatory element-binding protein cleavage-activating protein n=1 Tax=Lyophyllum shimeji TaxID=47721 RepID=A0A9P3PGD8_LYOSH|nr:putative sterol-sensing domain of SREBP cleavage-activation [Lyophyllum shimeji]
MFNHVNRMIRWSRTLGQRLFLRFGLHCATHQIRIILVSCVVITSLFYPTLAIYTSSQTRTLSIIDTFLSRSTISAFDAQKDLVDLWSHNSLRVHDDNIARAKCGASSALRVERLLIQGPEDDEGAFTRQTLLSTLELENHLETLISGGNTPCLKRPDGKCFVLSPLLFWNHDREALVSDPNILDTLNASKVISLGGVLVTPQMVLARRGSHQPHVAGSKFDFAKFLAITYFFPESDCVGTSEHAAWLRSVRRALAQHPEPVTQIQEPTVFALEYNDRDSPKGRAGLCYRPLCVTFTALVEIAVSTITSLSVCALVGFKVTMVPWELLPIVIVFVGAENMFNLVDAVTKTPVTLSVKQRIAEGLSRAGTSNTLKVVTYNCILGIIAVFSVGAIRQFCSFAIVVLVAHWFLAHTFFLAVLSIDLQRLELDELLRHGSSTLAPAIPRATKEDHSKRPRTPWQKLVLTTQNLLKGRATTNLSLLLLLAITATLYYTTYTSTVGDEQTFDSQLGGYHKALAKIAEKPPVWHIWKTLNPTESPLLHFRVEVPNVVTFRPDSSPTPKRPRPHFSMRTFRLAFWLLKIMVLPIAATTSALYGLLLYLLKNTELLEAQRNRAEPDAPEYQEVAKVLEKQISFSTLPRAFASDVELIAASKDANMVVSVGLHNEVGIWRADTKARVSIDTTDVLLRTASTSSAVSTVTSVAVDDDGCYCAVGTGAGMIAVWALEETNVRPFPLLALDHSSAAVTEIQFALMPETGLVLLATYESGVAAKWLLERDLAATHLTPSRRTPIVKCSLVRVHPLDRFLVAFSLDDGTLEIVDARDDDSLIMHDFCVQAGDGIDMASKVHACQTELGGSARLLVAVATEAGLVTLWDGLNGECISVFDEAYGRINRLRVTPVRCETCHFCGQLPLESVSIALSVDHVVRLFRLYVNDETRRCSCSRHQLRNVSSRDNLGRRSRSNSTTSTTSQMGSVSPSIPRARLATTFEASAFPVSGHGVHSRRASEKDTGRRSSELLTVPFPSEEYDSDSRHSSNPHSFWRNAVLVRETDITCERGAWGVNGRRLVGVRRKPRLQAGAQGGTAALLKSASSRGLTTATLERWELWTFDPSVSRLQSALLAALTTERDRGDKSSSCSPTGSSSDCVPRLPFTRVSPLVIAHTHAVAGFGNTLGLFHFSS